MPHRETFLSVGLDKEAPESVVQRLGPGLGCGPGVLGPRQLRLPSAWVVADHGGGGLGVQGPNSSGHRSLCAAVKPEADGGEGAVRPLGLPPGAPDARTRPRGAALDVIPAHLGAAGVTLRQVLGCDRHPSRTRPPSLGLRQARSARAPHCLSLGTHGEHVPCVVPRAQKQVESRRAGSVGRGFRAGLGAGAQPWEALSKPAISGVLRASGRPCTGAGRALVTVSEAASGAPVGAPPSRPTGVRLSVQRPIRPSPPPR